MCQLHQLVSEITFKQANTGTRNSPAASDQRPDQLPDQHVPWLQGFHTGLTDLRTPCAPFLFGPVLVLLDFSMVRQAPEFAIPLLIQAVTHPLPSW